MNILPTNSLDNPEFLPASADTLDTISGNQLLDGRLHAAQAAIHIEAEDLDPTGYRIATYNDFDFISDNSLLSLRGNGTNSGQATETFEGPEGQYDIKVGFYDENDDQATLNVTVNGDKQLTA